MLHEEEKEEKRKKEQEEIRKRIQEVERQEAEEREADRERKRERARRAKKAGLDAIRKGKYFELLNSHNSHRQPCSRCLGTTPLTFIVQWLGSTCRKLCIQLNRSACRMCNGLVTVVSMY